MTSKKLFLHTLSTLFVLSACFLFNTNPAFSEVDNEQKEKWKTVWDQREKNNPYILNPEGEEDLSGLATDSTEVVL